MLKKIKSRDEDENTQRVRYCKAVCVCVCGGGGGARKSEVIFYISNLNNRRLFPYAPVLYFGSSRCCVSHTDSPENRGPKRGAQKPTTNFLQHSWLKPGPCTPSPRPPAIPSPVDGF